MLYILSENVRIKIYKCRVVLLRYVTWSLTLHKEHRLSVIENRMSKGIFGPQREKVVGVWGQFHSEELRVLTLKEITLEEYGDRPVARIRGMRNVYDIFAGELEGQKLLICRSVISR
jgi:hypothetical protein